jgi:hypothetical protein
VKQYDHVESPDAVFFGRLEKIREAKQNTGQYHGKSHLQEKGCGGRIHGPVEHVEGKMEDHPDHGQNDRPESDRLLHNFPVFKEKVLPHLQRTFRNDISPSLKDRVTPQVCHHLQISRTLISGQSATAYPDIMSIY